MIGFLVGAVLALIATNALAHLAIYKLYRHIEAHNERILALEGQMATVNLRITEADAVFRTPSPAQRFPSVDPHQFIPDPTSIVPDETCATCGFDPRNRRHG
jgi:hypothetical protein